MEAVDCSRRDKMVGLIADNNGDVESLIRVDICSWFVEETVWFSKDYGSGLIRLYEFNLAVLVIILWTWEIRNLLQSSFPG